MALVLSFFFAFTFILMINLFVIRKYKVMNIKSTNLTLLASAFLELECKDLSEQVTQCEMIRWDAWNVWKCIDLCVWYILKINNNVNQITPAALQWCQYPLIKWLIVLQVWLLFHQIMVVTLYLPPWLTWGWPSHWSHSCQDLPLVRLRNWAHQLFGGLVLILF